jgi:hypothetical protein
MEDRGRDHTTVAGLDVSARSLASELPELGLGVGYSSDGGVDDADYAADLWAMLREPDAPPKSKHDPAILREAAELVAASPDDDHYHGPMTFSADRFADYLAR